MMMDHCWQKNVEMEVKNEKAVKGKPRILMFLLKVKVRSLFLSLPPAAGWVGVKNVPTESSPGDDLQLRLQVSHSDAKHSSDTWTLHL